MPKRWIKLLKRLRNDFKIEYFPNGEDKDDTRPYFIVQSYFYSTLNFRYRRYYIVPDDSIKEIRKGYGLLQISNTIICASYEEALYNAREYRIYQIRQYYNRRPKRKQKPSDGKRY